MSNFFSRLFSNRLSEDENERLHELNHVRAQVGALAASSRKWRPCDLSVLVSAEYANPSSPTSTIGYTSGHPVQKLPSSLGAKIYIRVKPGTWCELEWLSETDFLAARVRDSIKAEECEDFK